MLLIKAFGPDINIANVKPDDVFDTEALRVGGTLAGPAFYCGAASAHSSPTAASP
jgi:phosphosulfolactate synthase (CoM biosynthesis protein A)